MYIKKLLVLLTFTGFLSLYGCDSDTPIEKAGEAMTESAQDACDAVGDATDSSVDC